MRPKWLLQRGALPVAVELPDQAGDAICFPTATVPDYLNAHYWWAYIHPNAVKVFERQWLVNFILWGNYARLRDAALAELGEVLPGSTLQVACVYGDLTNCLCERARRGGGSIDVVDVLQIQLQNLRNELSADVPARLLRMDAMNLKLPNASYDRARAAGIVILSKIDLLPNLDFALSEAIDNVAKINPDAAVLQLSARSGQGMTEYYDWLRNEFAAAQQSAFA